MFFFLVPTTHGNAVDLEAQRDVLPCIQHCLEKEAGHARGSKNLIGFCFGDLGSTQCSIWMLEGETVHNELAEKALNARWDEDDFEEALTSTGMNGFTKFPRLFGPVAFAGGIKGEEAIDFFVTTTRGTLWCEENNTKKCLEAKDCADIIQATAPYADIGTPGPMIIRRPPLGCDVMLGSGDGGFEGKLYDICGFSEKRAAFFRDEENAAKVQAPKKRKPSTPHVVLE